MPARSASAWRSSWAERRCFASRTTATGWIPRTRDWRSSVMRRARSPALRTSARFGRSASAARRCRASRRSRISCCGAAPAAARPEPRFGSTAAPFPRSARSVRRKARRSRSGISSTTFPRGASFSSPTPRSRRRSPASSRRWRLGIRRLASRLRAALRQAQGRRAGSSLSVPRRTAWASDSFSCSVNVSI